MSEQKIFAGPRVRRIRNQAGLTQTAMAADLGISPSYLNLIERNQRPVSAALLVRLVETFDFDPRALTADAPCKPPPLLLWQGISGLTSSASPYRRTLLQEQCCKSTPAI